MFSKKDDVAMFQAYKEHKYPIRWLSQNTFKTRGFTRQQIAHRASYIGASKSQSKPFTDEENEIIIKAYNKKKNPIAFLLKNSTMGAYRTRDSIQKQASRLGLTTNKANLSQREKDIITKRIGDCSVLEIVKTLKNEGFKRGPSTVRSFIYRSGSTTVHGDRFSETDLKIFFKCSLKKIRKWEEVGLLVPIAKVSNRAYYRPIDVAKFIRYNPFELESHYIDTPWLVSLFEEFWNIMNTRAKNGGKDE